MLLVPHKIIGLIRNKRNKKLDDSLGDKNDHPTS